MPNRHRYLASLSDELSAQANRVRDLIGNRHWLSDGHHKEELLRTMLKRHLPVGIQASRGFVIDRFDPDNCSTEQDILIFDQTVNAPLFQQGDLAVAFHDQIVASISVKTKYSKRELDDSIHGLRYFMRSDYGVKKAWIGIFFFESTQAIRRKPEAIHQHLTDIGNMSTFEVNHICCGPSLAVKHRGYDTAKQYHGYHCANIAPALFIADLLDHVSEGRAGQTASFADIIDGCIFPTF